MQWYILQQQIVGKDTTRISQVEPCQQSKRLFVPFQRQLCMAKLDVDEDLQLRCSFTTPFSSPKRNSKKTYSHIKKKLKLISSLEKTPT